MPYTASRQKRTLIINLPCGVDKSTDLVVMIAALPEIHATVRALQEIGKEWNQGETIAVTDFVRTLVIVCARRSSKFAKAEDFCWTMIRVYAELHGKIQERVNWIMP